MAGLDYEIRPNVRLYLRNKKGRFESPRRYGATTPGGHAQLLAQKLLAQTRENVRSQLQGRWEPIQWDYQNGKRTGDPALENTEDQWMIEWLSQTKFRIIPKPKYRKSWYAHILGLRIYAKKKRMPIPFASGTVGLNVVKLPKRDPRPTQAQVDRIMKEFR